MNGEIAEALRSNRAVTVSIVVAAAAVTACALVAIAVMLGWTPPRDGAKAGAQGATGNGSVALAPGETLVAPQEAPKRPAPLMPSYSQPTPPPPAPPEDSQASRPATRAAAEPQAHPTDTFPVPTVPVPRTPSYSRPARERAPPPSIAENRPRPPICENCGKVSTITTYPGLWELRVRFEDGATRTFRFRSPPPFRIGDRVRYEDDRLVHD